MNFLYVGFYGEGIRHLALRTIKRTLKIFWK